MVRAKKILVVDDEPLVHTLMADFVTQRLGMQAVLAQDGVAALAALDTEPVDLVLLDIFMPGMDGLAVLRRIKAVQPTLPVIIVTSSSKIDHAIEALRLGARDFVRKPLDLDVLAHAIERVLHRQEVAKSPQTGREPRANRRRSGRARLLVPAQLQLRDVTMIDLSPEGGLVEHTDPVHLGDIYRLAFLLESRRVQVLARAVRAFASHRVTIAVGEWKMVYRTGLEFVGVDKATSEAIAAYTDRQQ